MVPLLGDAADLLHHPAGDGVGVALALDGEQVEQVGEVGGAGNQVAAVLLFLELLDHLVVFVPDLPHQLLHDVLQGHQALGAAVLVHYNNHVGLLPLENPQQLGDLGIAGGVQHGAGNGLYVGLTTIAGGVEVLLMDHADDVVDVLMVHRQPGVTALGEGLSDVVHGVGVLHRHDVHAGGEDLIHLHIIELDGGADELALVLVQPALDLGLVHHGHQLFLGDAAVPLLVKYHGQQLFQQAEQEVHRGKDHHENPHNGSGEHGKALGILLGQALGRDLAKDQHHNGDDGGRDHRAVLQPQALGEEHGGQRGGGQVDDVVAHQNGGQQVVVLVHQPEGQGGPAVAGVGLALQADAVEGGKGGLRGGEIGGQDHQNNQNHDHGQT